VYRDDVRALTELAKTAGVLLVLWAVLALAGWVGGAIPELSSGATVEVDAATDAGAEPSGDAGVADAPASTEDAAADPVPVAEAPSAGPPARTLCRAPAEVVWARADLAGDARPELLVGCEESIELLGTTGASLARIARIRPVRPTPLRAAAMGDVDGDERADVVLALEEGLFWVPRDAAGGLASPRVLAPSRNGAVALAEIDAAAGAEIVVVHGSDPRPELWVYRGGPSPVRVTSVPAPLAASSVAVADLDVDGHLDVVVVGAQQILLAFGDSRGGLPRTRSLAPGGRRALLADVAGDGAIEVVIERDEGSCAIAPAPSIADEGGCALLAGLEGARDLHASPEGLLAWRQPDLVRRTPDGASSPLATLATTTFGVHRFAFDPGPERGHAWLLGSTERDGARWLELIDVRLAEAPTIVTDGPREDVPDGPLPLELVLPDPDAP
jgi:hypothetical protein